MKIKLSSDDKLPLAKDNNTITINANNKCQHTVFHENNKFYPKDFLDKCLYKI